MRAEQKHYWGAPGLQSKQNTAWEGEEQEGWIVAVLLGLHPAGEAHLVFGGVGRYPKVQLQLQLALRAQRARAVPVLGAKLVPSCCARLRAVAQGQHGGSALLGGCCCHESGCWKPG